jgi:UDP-N-acetylmuramoylalanine--D-glutamate ligase
MSKYKGKKVLIVGFGVSGLSAAKYMVKQGARVTITDMKQKTELQEFVSQIGDLKIEFELGKHNPQTFKESELIVVSPGVALNIKPLEEAREAGVTITSEIDLAAQALEQPLIAVTGTNGKTTVTSLLGEMFKADHKPAFVGGNIGTPLLDYVSDGLKADFIVAELSSFQIEAAQKVVPAAAIFTNIEPDHLDRYPSFEAYAEAKRKLLKACDRNTYVILNYDNDITRKFGDENIGKLLWFTKKDPMKIGGQFAENFNGVYYNAAEKKIHSRIFGKEEVYDVSQVKVYGEHNKENFMAAICAARSMGVSAEAIQQVITSFRGVAHRLEFVRKKDGVFFFNDSKATNPQSMLRALQSFPANPVILISGGKDKNFDFTPLQETVRQRVKILILMGEAKEKLNRAIGDFTETFLVGTFEEAILLAFQKSRNGDIILMSPGCASFDMFKNYEERGDYYKKLVHSL